MPLCVNGVCRRGVRTVVVVCRGLVNAGRGLLLRSATVVRGVVTADEVHDIITKGFIKVRVDIQVIIIIALVWAIDVVLDRISNGVRIASLLIIIAVTKARGAALTIILIVSRLHLVLRKEVVIHIYI